VSLGRPGLRPLLAAALLVTYAAGCGTSDRPTPEPTGSHREDSGDEGAEGTGGIEDVAATPAVLDWKPTGGGPEDRRTVGPEWTALVDEPGTTATFEGPSGRVTVETGGRRPVGDLLMNADWAVVVASDEQQQLPVLAKLVDLSDGTTHDITHPAPSPSSYALAGDRVLYGTYDRGGAYCLAEVEAATGTGDFTWCAPKRTGLTRVTHGAGGTAFLSFDDQRPVSCRTPMLFSDGRARPVEEAADCSAWDVAATPGGAVWSEVRRERQAEEGDFRAVADGTTYDLGPGTTGTLLPCGDSVWFVRDPQSRTEPARLMRWTPDATLEVAFESEAQGTAFLAPPECAGDVLTVSSFGPGGDAQVSATVP
jgi:hypothetical protein